MRRYLMAFIFVSLPVAGVLTIVAGAATAQPAPRSSAQSAAGGVDLAALDRSVDPCADFYQFACGGWTASHPVPADRSSWARFDELQERNDETLHRILETAAANPTADGRQIGDYYGSCMDEAGIDAKGSTPLQPDLDAIASLTDLKALPALLAKLHPIGVNAFFRLTSSPDFENADVELALVFPGGLGLPDRDYYFRDDPRTTDLRREYTAHVGRMSQLLGTPADRAAAAAVTVMRIETVLAKAQLDLVSRRDPAKVNHKMTAAELQALTPGFEWRRYFDGIGAHNISSLNVTQPDFMGAFSALLAATPVEDVRTYLTWQLVHANATVLSTSFVNENFRFYGTALSGTPQLRPRWKRCVEYTDGDLGEALGKAYVKDAFGGTAKAETV